MSSMASRTSPMSALVVVGFAVAVVLLFNVRDGVAMSDEKRLIKFLLENYETVGVIGRPVFNTSETIKVYYGLALIQILDLDEKNQVLTTNVWSRYVWHDILLRWDPDNFGGVSQVRVPSNRIWTPDIKLYNYADARLTEHREAMAVVSNDGTVLWIPPAIFQSSCSIDITHFPFDTQKCDMKFGSWTYDGFKLDMLFFENMSSIDVSDYVESNEWALLESPAKRNVKYYSCCAEPYPDLTFTIRVKRIAVFYNYVLVLPCVLLSFLTLVIFWLPPESPAKMMLGMNIFVAFFVLLLLLADSTPPAASSIPLIGAYFCMNMILITLSTFLAVIVITAHIRGDRKNQVPQWLRTITINGLARIMCMSEFLDLDMMLSKIPVPRLPSRLDETAPLHPGASGERRQVITVNTGNHCGKPGESEATGAGSGRPRQQIVRLQQPAPATATGSATTTVVTSADSQPELTSSKSASAEEVPTVLCAGCGTRVKASTPTLETDVREIRRMLQTYAARLGERDAHARTTKQWRLVARVFDRLFFFIYCATIIVSLATIFPRG